MREPLLYLADIRDAALAIAEFTEGMAYEEFVTDDRTASAVIRKFEVIGEASRQIPGTIRQRYPEMPWQEMIDLQERYIRTYYEIDLTQVWGRIVNQVPGLLHRRPGHSQQGGGGAVRGGDGANLLLAAPREIPGAMAR